jgi:hypothetical protein
VPDFVVTRLREGSRPEKRGNFKIRDHHHDTGHKKGWEYYPLLTTSGRQKSTGHKKGWTVLIFRSQG